MASETSVQAFVHKLEEGGWARPLRVTLIVVALLAIALFLVFWRFKGLSSQEGMDQAQIAREMARGNGFSTKFIRPLQYAQLREFRGDGNFPEGTSIPDVYHGPLNPTITAPFLWLARGTWDLDPASKTIVYPSDRIVAALGIGFFLIAVLINFYTARRLFDEKLALLGSGLLLVCGMLWNIAVAGVPILLAMMLFSGVTYCLVRATEAHYAEKPSLVWMLACGVLSGLMLLANAITIWVLLGAAFFTGLLLRPRGRDTAIMVGVALLIYAPWLIRNYQVSGNPAGIAAYALLDGIRGSESGIMRSMQTGVVGVSMGGLRGKVLSQFGDQLAGMFEMLGRGLAAPVFFLALLHAFKRQEASIFRWGVLAMLLPALGGMCLAGANGPLSPNNLYVLFVPMMTFYGLAFLLVLWGRTGLEVPLFRVVFLVLIYGVSALSLVATLVASGGAVNWPPYLPPYLAILNNWFGEDEIIVSDQPWAVAWYADRRSLWVPESPKVFTDLSDFRRLNAPLSALHLTPVSGDTPFMSGIWHGEWKEWMPFILRGPNLQTFPLKQVTGFIGGDIILLADTARWEGKMPDKGAMADLEAAARAEPARETTPADAEATPSPAP